MLLDYVERLEKHRVGRRAVEVKLSRLRPYNQRPHHIRIVKKAFEPLVRKYQAGIYELSNNNIMVLTKDAAVAEIEACAELLGERLGEVRGAVQPGRRIATVRRQAGLGLPVALISEEAR